MKIKIKGKEIDPNENEYGQWVIKLLTLFLFMGVIALFVNQTSTHIESPEVRAANVCSIPEHDWGNETLNTKWSQVLSHCVFIEKYAEQYDELDPIFLAAIIMQESGGDSHVISYSGAVGLMQIMPREATGFMCANGPCFADRPSTEELLDPEYNISWGTEFLVKKIQLWGEDAALCWYNTGTVVNDCIFLQKIDAIIKAVKN